MHTQTTDFKRFKMSNNTDIMSLMSILLTANYIRSICLQFEANLKVFKCHLELRSFLLGVTRFTLWVGPCSSRLKASLSPLNTLQLSQIQVSPVDPNGKHLLLKYQADWLCCLGEIIHQSLISGRRPKMAAPRVIALSVTHSVCWLRSSLWMVFSDLFCMLLS